MINRANTEKLRSKFNQLAKTWLMETGILSNTGLALENPAYKEILEMGEDVVPLILENLRFPGGHWFQALHILTGRECSLQKPAYYSYIHVREDWLNWGKQEGLIDIEPNIYEAAALAKITKWKKEGYKMASLCNYINYETTPCNEKGPTKYDYFPIRYHDLDDIEVFYELTQEERRKVK
jgi:hypothetical protein